MTYPDRVTAAAELDAMTPAERHADFESRVVDPRNMPHLPGADQAGVRRLLARSQARLVERISAQEGPRAAQEALATIAEHDGPTARAEVERLIGRGNARTA